MAYEQHTWQSNEFVTAEKLNNIENGVAYSQGKKWEVTIAANSWTLDNGIYTYTTSLGDITSASWVDANAHGYENYFTDPIDWEIKSNNVVEFSTTSVPTGTIIVTIVAWGTVEGTEGEVIVPIYDGVDSTDVNKALSAKQGKIINDKVSAIEEAITPFAITITTGQWNGTGSDRYITVNASNVNENSILIPRYDHASESVLNGPIWCVPANGSFTIHTTAIPSGSITVVVLFAGTMGEAQYQVLADVYSKSQTYSKDQVYTKTETDTAIQQSTATVSGSATAASGITLSTFSVRKAGNVVIIHGVATISGSIAGNLAVVFTLPDGYKPADEIYFNSIATYNGTAQPSTFAINPSGQFRTRTGGGTFTGVIYVDCIYAV